MNIKINKLQRSKKPLYATVYDKLYDLIMDGTFPPESKLPSEPELAKMIGVSRMTLRQAITLLQDDGLIKSIHGKGNFVTKSQNKNRSIGLEKVGNPLYKCHTEDIDQVEIDFRMDIASEYMQWVLKRDTQAVIAFERWYKSKNNVVGYAFSLMAMETVSELNLDLKDETLLLDMLEGGIYSIANTSEIEIKRSTAGDSPSQKYKILGGEQCNLILESVHLNDIYPILYNKYYIPVDFSQIKINASL